MEKRRFSRVPFRTLASVTSIDGTTTIEGEVDNLSLNGMLLSTDQVLQEGTDVHIEIFLQGGAPDLEIVLDGKVVRQLTKSVAIQFNMHRIPLESLTHLRYVVSYNLGDSDVVMEEYFNHIGTDLNVDDDNFERDS